MGQQFEVDKADFKRSELAVAPRRELADGEVRCEIDFFAFTANNLTYAVAGDMLGYWQFFPASAPTRGVIPVWGFADVVESKAGDISVGERIYGYLPPAEEFILQPSQVKAGSWFDASAHRQALPPLYNRYQRQPQRSAEQRPAEIGQALLGPLYMTGYLIADFLKVNEFFGSDQVVVLSASSKTSIGLALALSQVSSPPVIGVTSAGNRAFVHSLDYYSEVVTYDGLDELQDKPTVVVDMAGNGSLEASLKTRFGEQLRYFLKVGLTHWDQVSGAPGEGTDTESFFFAPSYMLERSGEDPSLPQRVQSFVAEGAASSMGWLELNMLSGLEGLASVYEDVCDGVASPRQGMICQLG